MDKARIYPYNLSMSIAIWWIRRDLRLHDNEALTAAVRAGNGVVPLFIVDPFFAQSPMVGEKRPSFLYAGLGELDAALQQCGSRLIVRHGEPAAVLQKLIGETDATAVFAEADTSPYARRRDAAVAAQLPLQLLPGLTVHHPRDVLKNDGTPYTVFTPYMRRWRERPFPHHNSLLPAPAGINTPSSIRSEPIPSSILSDAIPFPPGEAEAQRRLSAFAAGTDAPVFRYAEDRNLPGVDGTSQLSPYLRFGMVSARQVVIAAVSAIARAQTPSARKGAETWLSELIWREFYQSIMAHFPHVARGSFRPQYDKIVWRNDPDEFAKWCNGRTGYLIVDAAMRQLSQTGWMHNRARMIVASFLVKDLLIDWRWGEYWFMQQLVDGDPAANNGGWQWTAGTGTDAAPYFRIFNPTTQGKKFDPDGTYIRRWVPELADIPTTYIHEPSQMPPLSQQQHNFVPGRDYPVPIVDHKLARQRTLDAYKITKEM